MSNLKIYVFPILVFTFMVLKIASVSANDNFERLSYLDWQEINKNKVGKLKYHKEFPFDKSDVIGFTFGNPNDYINYKVDFVVWGHAFQSKDSKWEYFEKRIQSAKEFGILSSALIGTRTFWRGFIDYSNGNLKEVCCKKLDGTSVLLNKGVNNYKGHPSYWFCTNNPMFRDYLKSITKVAMQYHPDGFMMDDPSGTAAVTLWHEGCYCKHCIKQFREYLKLKFTKEQLKEKGITDIENFDLQTFHKKYAHLPPKKRPLRREILEFQFEASAKMYREIADYAIQQRGKNILISGNIDPSNRYQGALFKHVDYFACECPMEASSGSLPTGRNLLAYKIAEALKRPVVIMGRGEDHSHVESMNLPGIVRCWIAEAYAFGNYFVAPYNLWAYSKDKGPHYFELPHHEKLIAPLYQFIKRYHVYFDEYETLAQIAVVHDLNTHKLGSDRMSPLINKLAEMNLPFNIVVSGGSVLDVPLNYVELKKYKNIFLPCHTQINSNDLETLEKYALNGGVLVRKLKGIDMSTRIEIGNGENVRARIGFAPTNSEKPIVIHLLNRSYDQKTDSCFAKKKFKVKVPKCLLKNINIDHIKYVSAPALRSRKMLPLNENYQQKGSDERIVTHICVDGFIEIEIPELLEWGILVLFTSDYVDMNVNN